MIEASRRRSHGPDARERGVRVQRYIYLPLALRTETFLYLISSITLSIQSATRAKRPASYPFVHLHGRHWTTTWRPAKREVTSVGATARFERSAKFLYFVGGKELTRYVDLFRTPVIASPSDIRFRPPARPSSGGREMTNGYDAGRLRASHD